MTTTSPEPPPAETFGLPECDAHLIAKLRNMDPALLAQIRPTRKQNNEHSPIT